MWVLRFNFQNVIGHRVVDKKKHAKTQIRKAIMEFQKLKSQRLRANSDSDYEDIPEEEDVKSEEEESKDTLGQLDELNDKILDFRILDHMNQKNYLPSDFQFYSERELRDIESEHYGKQIDCPHNMVIREYVDHAISKNLNEMLKNLIQTLKRFYQRKLQQLGPSQRHKARKRLITGIREVSRSV